jgi:hypothetical protein
MKDYVLMFRMDITTAGAQPTAQQMKVYMKQWEQWINGIESRGNLAEGGNHFSREGKVLKPHNTITDGPYTAGNESVVGYLVIHAKDMKDAVSMAEKCPILAGEGTSVEIRETASPGQ